MQWLLKLLSQTTMLPRTDRVTTIKLHVVKNHIKILSILDIEVIMAFFSTFARFKL